MINSYDVAILSEKVAYLEAALKSAGIELPVVTAADNGKTLQVVNGAWATGDKMPEDELPNVTASDNGKALQVVNGAWAIGTSITPEVVEGFSLDTTNVDTENTNVSVYKIGKLVIVNIIALSCKIDLAGASDLITGLPKPIANMSSTCWGQTDSTPIPLRMRAREDGSNGKISLWYDNMATGKAIVGSVIYISE